MADFATLTQNITWLRSFDCVQIILEHTITGRIHKKISSKRTKSTNRY